MRGTARFSAREGKAFSAQRAAPLTRLAEFGDERGNSVGVIFRIEEKALCGLFKYWKKKIFSEKP
jgi:hypothetical protein